MRYLLKAVLSLSVLGAITLVVYAVFSDLPPPQREVLIPVAVN